MNTDSIRHLYDHSFWATKKILDATQKLTPEQYDGHPWDTASIHEIMTHTLAASTVWLARWLGDAVPPLHVVPGEPGLHQVGIATPGGTIVLP